MDDEGHALEGPFSTRADYDTVFLFHDLASMQGQKWDLVQDILDYSLPGTMVQWLFSFDVRGMKPVL